MSIILAIEAVGARITSLEKHFSNHVSQHTIDKIVKAIEWLLIILLFSFLNWGLVKVPNQNKEKNHIERLEKKIINKVEKTGGI